MTPHRHPLPALTGLRFFLAVWVVVFHVIPTTLTLEIPWLPSAPAAVDCLLRTGYVAVTIFFVLSGFVLAYNYDLGRVWTQRERWRFAIARFSRIYPAYVAGLAALVPVALYRIWQRIPAGEYSLSSGALSVLLIQSWFPERALSWNYPGWSLSAEAFFYALFPIAGYWLWKLRSRGKVIAGLAVLWLLSLAAPLAAVVIPIPGFGDVPAAGGVPGAAGEPWGSLISYHPLSGLPAFATGVLLAALYRSLPEDSPWFRRADWLSVPALAVICLTLANADQLPLAVVRNGLLLPLYSILIFGLALGNGFMARFLGLPALVFLGNASYAMYILHFPIGEWLLLARRWFDIRAPEGAGWEILYVLSVIAAASFFYKLIEEPVHKTLRRVLTAKLDRTAGANTPLHTGESSPISADSTRGNRS